MNNRIFNVNGRGDEQLLATLKLVFNQKGTNCGYKCEGTKFVQTKGLILLWFCEKSEHGNKLPVELTAEECFPFVKAWLKSEEAGKVDCESWDANSDHDGSNSIGWRVYCEDWGHVDGDPRAICAIKPDYMWHGK